jgi:hypothetical protein
MTKGIRDAELTFGPHFRLALRSVRGELWFELVATHHGFRVRADKAGGELDQITESVREQFPHLQVD